MAQEKGLLKTPFKFVFRTSVSLLLFGLIQSCAPRSPESALIKPNPEVSVPTKPSSVMDTINYDLIPTYHPELRPKNVNLKYEKPVAEIKTPQAIIHLNQVRMSKVSMTFDAATNKVSVKGQVEIIGDNGKVLAENSFLISGTQKPTEASFRLTSDANQKLNSDIKPTLGAQATCLAITEKDEPDCSSLVIDFFIAFQQKVYSEQMEIKRDIPKPLPMPVKVPESPKDSSPVIPEIKQEPKETAQFKESELQIEGEEDSAPGRFEGQAQVVDLTQMFPQDDQIQTTLKTYPAAPTDSPATPATLAHGTPAAPTEKTPPALKKEVAPDKEKTPAEPVKAKEPTAPPKKSSITNDVAVTPAGLIRPMNQAIGFPNKGTLRNATSLLMKQTTLEKKSFFEIVFPQRARYFGTYEMAEILSRMGEHLNSKFNKKLAVSDISKSSGGFLGPHLSHQIGMDVDLGYPSAHDAVKIPVVVDMKSRKYYPEAFSITKTYDLLKFAFQQHDLKIDRIFIDRTIKKALCEHAKANGEFQGENKTQVQELFKIMEHVDGHGDHFHLRLKCTSAHPACRHITYIENKGCD